MIRLETQPISSAERETLLQELAALRAENRALRGQLPKRHRYSTIVRRAVTDAHLLLMAAYGGDSTGCLAMEQNYGLARRRWQWAVAFLRYAGIVAMRTHNWRDGLPFVVDELEEAIVLLEQATVELDGPGGYKRLKAIHG